LFARALISLETWIKISFSRALPAVEASKGGHDEDQRARGKEHREAGDGWHEEDDLGLGSSDISLTPLLKLHLKVRLDIHLNWSGVCQSALTYFNSETHGRS